MRCHASLEEFKKSIEYNHLYAFSTRASRRFTDARFVAGDALLFGPETRGLPVEVLNSLGSDYCLRIPLVNHSRSLNLSNSVAIAVYEAWRQLGFENT